jgi:hypothetical protein
MSIEGYLSNLSVVSTVPSAFSKTNETELTLFDIELA